MCGCSLRGHCLQLAQSCLVCFGSRFQVGFQDSLVFAYLLHRRVEQALRVCVVKCHTLLFQVAHEESLSFSAHFLLSRGVNDYAFSKS